MKYQLLDKGDAILETDEWWDRDLQEWGPTGMTGVVHGESNLFRRPIQSWQPIETAPKDGTPILVGWWEQVTEFDYVNRKHIHTDWLFGSTVVRWDKCYSGEYDWELAEVGGYAAESDLDHLPTVWMPLPNDPEKPSINEIEK